MRQFITRNVKTINRAQKKKTIRDRPADKVKKKKKGVLREIERVELASGARVEILKRGQSRKGELGLGESINYFIFFLKLSN